MEEVLDGFKVTVGNARSWIRCKEEILDRESSCPSSGRFWAKAECIDVIVYPHEWPHFVSHDTSHLVELPSSVHPGSAAWPGQNPQASRKTTERGHYRISIVLPRGGPDDLGGKCSDAFTHAPRQAQVKDHAESVPLVQHHLVLFEVVEAGKPGIEGECVEDAIDIEEQKGMLGAGVLHSPMQPTFPVFRLIAWQATNTTSANPSLLSLVCTSSAAQTRCFQGVFPCRTKQGERRRHPHGSVFQAHGRACFHTASASSRGQVSANGVGVPDPRHLASR